MVIVLIVILAIVVLIVLWMIGAYNSMIRLRNQVRNAWYSLSYGAGILLRRVGDDETASLSHAPEVKGH